MVRRALRSKSLRKVKVKTPGGDTVTHYRKRKPSKAHCGNCGRVLSGVARARQTELKNMAKTKKRPERPYGGNLCSKCMRSLIVEKARSQ